MKMIKSIFYRPDKAMPAFKVDDDRFGKDAGYDLYALKDTWFWPFQTIGIESNSHIHIPIRHLGRVTSRSGHSKKGWLVHAGTIDHGYSGNIGIIMTNLSLFPRKIKAGTRVAQLIFMPFSIVKLDEILYEEHFEQLVTEYSKSNRGSNGFGHSGE